MAAPWKYSDELKERAARLALDARRDQGSKVGGSSRSRTSSVSTPRRCAPGSGRLRSTARAVRDQALIGDIRIAHRANLGVYGARKSRTEMNRQGVPVARCTVERLMRKGGIRGCRIVRVRGMGFLRKDDTDDHDRQGCSNEASTLAGKGARRLRESGVLDDLFARIDAGGVQLDGKDRLIQQPIKAGPERGLHAELTDHVGCERGDAEAALHDNSRNGSFPKTVSTVADQVAEEVLA